MHRGSRSPARTRAQPHTRCSPPRSPQQSLRNREDPGLGDPRGIGQTANLLGGLDATNRPEEGGGRNEADSRKALFKRRMKVARDGSLVDADGHAEKIKVADRDYQRVERSRGTGGVPHDRLELFLAVVELDR